MNYRLVCKLLGLIALLISGMMLFSLPWAFPELGYRKGIELPMEVGFESSGFYGLIESILISGALGLLLLGIGGKTEGVLYHKEAMAVVGLTWIMATVLGGLPFVLSGTYRGPAIRQSDANDYLYLHRPDWFVFSQWEPKYELSYDQKSAVQQLIDAGARGVLAEDISAANQQTVRSLAESDEDFGRILLLPDGGGDRYRIAWVRMTFADALFESQSGFSTTGATVMSELEESLLVPHCILFWRSSTHFLGGLGIIVLFVAILGQGSSGKALMRNEVPGPSQDGAQARMQHTAWVFAGMYVGLTAVLSLMLRFCGLTWFDALCHAAGTMGTGGFSTYNASLGHFDSGLIDSIVIIFMILAGMNFTLLYFMLVLGNPMTMLKDAEWRTYIGIIAVATLFIVVIGYWQGEFTDDTGQKSLIASLRFGLFQVVSVMTTTGFGTHDYDNWNSFSRGILLLLMFVGGCAGSTGGGIKVIRLLLLSKILGLELERAHHPRVVRTLRLGGKPVEQKDLRNSILVYFAVLTVIFVFSWLFVVAVEADSTWAGQEQHKLIDSASAVAATLNNIGPGLGTVGPTRNYGHFSTSSKLLFTWLMVLGRVEVFAVLVLLMPSFWRTR